MAAYASEASLGKVRYRDPDERLRFFTRNVATYTKRALEVFKFDLSVHGWDSELMNSKNFLMVSNHLSYVDILALSSVQPCVFVTSVDLGESSFLGPMAEMGGSIFVERRHRGQIGRDLSKMSDTLRAGHNVVIYPEGTSSNGERVLPFKKALLMSAVQAGVDILPMTIKYTEIDGDPFNVANRDRICWYGEMEFLPHFLGVMKLQRVKAEIHFLEPIKVTPESSRHELAELAHKRISEKYGDPLGIQTSSEKTDF